MWYPVANSGFHGGYSLATSAHTKGPNYFFSCGRNCFFWPKGVWTQFDHGLVWAAYKRELEQDRQPHGSISCIRYNEIRRALVYQHMYHWQLLPHRQPTGEKNIQVMKCDKLSFKSNSIVITKNANLSFSPKLFAASGSRSALVFFVLLRVRLCIAR